MAAYRQHEDESKKAAREARCGLLPSAFQQTTRSSLVAHLYAQTDIHIPYVNTTAPRYCTHTHGAQSVFKNDACAHNAARQTFDDVVFVKLHKRGLALFRQLSA